MYLDLVAIVLTREIPVSLRWLVNPLVNDLSINFLTTTFLSRRVVASREDLRRLL